MSLECDAAVVFSISMQDEEEIAKKKQANRADCRGYIDTSELAGRHGFCCCTAVINCFSRHRRIWKKSEKMQSKRRSTLTVWIFVQAASWLHQSLQTIRSAFEIVETPFSTPKCTWKMFAYLAFLSYSAPILSAFGDGRVRWRQQQLYHPFHPVEDADAELRKAKLKKEPSETKETKKEDWIQVDSRT